MVRAPRRPLARFVVVVTAVTSLIIGWRFQPTDWSPHEPGEFGLPVASLDELAETLGEASAGVVVKDGYLIYSWGDAHRPADWGSATKPFVSTLLMFAVHHGWLTGVDHPVLDFVPDLRPEDREMTFAHLANMTSGYSLPERPGQAWAYNDYGMKLYFEALLERVFGLDPTDILAAEAFVRHPRRLGALAFQDGRIFKRKKRTLRLYMSPRDFARVGWLWCTKGRWSGHQLLPRELLDTYLSPAVPAALPRSSGNAVDDYLGVGTVGHQGNNIPKLSVGPGVFGYSWWFNTDGALWPDLPPDTFQANGHFNREALTVIPSRGLVIAWVGAFEESWSVEDWLASANATLRPVVDALADEGAQSRCAIPPQ